MSLKKITVLGLTITLLLSATACGKKNTNENAPQPVVDVKVEERDDAAKYQYDKNDLTMIDTFTGNSVTIGMSLTDIEAITGTPIRKNGDYKVYDGIAVQYDGETSVAFVISGGEFDDSTSRNRYKTTRGIGLDTSYKEFKMAYGEITNQFKKATADSDQGQGTAEAPANAVRYFKVDGENISYLGETRTDEIKNQDPTKVYMQYFMFDKKTDDVSAIRITRIDKIGR